jgi:hypothetical protein
MTGVFMILNDKRIIKNWVHVFWILKYLWEMWITNHPDLRSTLLEKEGSWSDYACGWSGWIFGLNKITDLRSTLLGKEVTELTSPLAGLGGIFGMKNPRPAVDPPWQGG